MLLKDPGKETPESLTSFGFLLFVSLFVCFKDAVFVHWMSWKAKLTGRHTHINPFLCPHLIVREYYCNIWPCTSKSSFNNCACGNKHTATVYVLGGRGKKRNWQFLHTETVCLFCLSLMERLTTYPKAIIIKMKNKVNCERVWWIVYSNMNKVFTQK